MSGKIIHIDFGDCFEVAMVREKFPEKIPFRLTRMLINAMEVLCLLHAFIGKKKNHLLVLVLKELQLEVTIYSFYYRHKEFNAIFSLKSYPLSYITSKLYMYSILFLKNLKKKLGLLKSKTLLGCPIYN